MYWLLKRPRWQSAKTLKIGRWAERQFIAHSLSESRVQSTELVSRTRGRGAGKRACLSAKLRAKPTAKTVPAHVL